MKNFVILPARDNSPIGKVSAFGGHISPKEEIGHALGVLLLIVSIIKLLKMCLCRNDISGSICRTREPDPWRASNLSWFAHPQFASSTAASRLAPVECRFLFDLDRTLRHCQKAPSRHLCWDCHGGG